MRLKPSSLLYANAQLLRTLKPGEQLTLSSQGELKKLTRPHERLAFCIKNGLLFGRPKRSIWKAIYMTMQRLCLEVKNPLERKALQLKKCKTVENAIQVKERLEVLKGMKRHEGRLSQMILEYQRKSLFQERLLRKIEIAVQRSPYRFSKTGIAEELQIGRPFQTPKMGCSGAYFIEGSYKTIFGLFKPFDEEIGAPNNPSSAFFKGGIGSQLKGYNTYVGEGVHREVAAYVVDQELQLGIVPKTSYAQLEHTSFYQSTEARHSKQSQKKLGSLQEYKAGYRMLAEMKVHNIEKIPFDQFHRMVLLDLLIGNMDRNRGNLLTDGHRLIAIDHALSFASEHVKANQSIWLEWPQLKVSFSSYLREKILHFSVEKLAAKLKKGCFFEERCLFRFKERVALVRTGLKQGLTPKELMRLLSIDHLNQLKDYSLTLEARCHEILKRVKLSSAQKGKESV